MARTVTANIDYTNRDYEAHRTAMIAKLKELMPSYTDTSQTDAGIVILEALAMGLDISSFYQDCQANEAMLLTANQRKSALNWCKMLSYTPQYATPSRAMQVFVLSSAQATNTTIPKGTVVKTVASPTEPAVPFLTESVLIIPAGKLGNEKDESGNYLYTVSVVQGTQVTNEYVGSSDGTAGQKFDLSFYPVVYDSVNLRVNEGSSWNTWAVVDNFVDSTNISKNFLLNILDDNRAEIEFGDGSNGKIPLKYSNGIVCDYITGGGTSGNVAANTITALSSSLSVVSSTFNPATVYELGKNKETLSSIKINAPIANLNRWGALTTSDFSAVVLMEFTDVQYASAVKDPVNIDDITIYLMLYNNATLTDARKSEILATMNERKLVGVGTITLTQVALNALDLTASVIVADNYLSTTVQSQITAYLQSYFAVGNLEIAEEISVTDLESKVVSNVRGIKSFRVTSPSDLVIATAENKVTTLNKVTLNATGGV